MFDEAVLPFMKQYSWVYPLVFVLIAIWPLYVLLSTLYRSSDKIAELATGKIAEASGEMVRCPECGELVIKTAAYCPNCSTKIAVLKSEATTVKCSKCGAENKPKDRYCLACGRPLASGETGYKRTLRRK